MERPEEILLYTDVPEAYLNFPSHFINKLCKILLAIIKLFKKLFKLSSFGKSRKLEMEKESRYPLDAAFTHPVPLLLLHGESWMHISLLSDEQFKHEAVRHFG